MAAKWIVRLITLGGLVSLETALYRHDDGIILEFIVVNLFLFMLLTLFGSDKSYTELAEEKVRR